MIIYVYFIIPDNQKTLKKEDSFYNQVITLKRPMSKETPILM